MAMTCNEILIWMEKIMKSQGIATITEREYEDAKMIYEEIKKLCADGQREEAHDKATFLAGMVEEFENSPTGD